MVLTNDYEQQARLTAIDIATRIVSMKLQHPPILLDMAALEPQFSELSWEERNKWLEKGLQKMRDTPMTFTAEKESEEPMTIEVDIEKTYTKVLKLLCQK